MKVLCDPVFFDELKQVYPAIELDVFSQSPEQAYERARETERDEAFGLVYRAINAEEDLSEVRDHLNLGFESPLFGNQDDPRFPDMSRVYEPTDPGGCLVLEGNSELAADWPEPNIQIQQGLWDAIALKHRGARLKAWVAGSSSKASEIELNTE